MKKFLLLSLMILAAGVLVYAQNVDTSSLPKGKWVDHNYDAVWELGSDNIRILDTAGKVLYDFRDKIGDFKIEPGMTGVSFSFTCKDAGRKYKFTKGMTDLDLTMEILRDWRPDLYTVKMKMAK